MKRLCFIQRTANVILVVSLLHSIDVTTKRSMSNLIKRCQDKETEVITLIYLVGLFRCTVVSDSIKKLNELNFVIALLKSISEKAFFVIFQIAIVIH